MQNILEILKTLRVQVTQQQSILDAVRLNIDNLIINCMNELLQPDDFGGIKNINHDAKNFGFPINVITRRGKIKDILQNSSKPMSAKEVKEELLSRGDDNAAKNVDQTLVNLEKDGQVKNVKINDGSSRKHYIVKE